MIIQRLFSSKAQKARRAKWDKKVANDIWGSYGNDIEGEEAKRLGRGTQRNNTVSLDKKSGKARVNYENSKIQDLTKRGSNEILSASKPIKDGVYYGGRNEVIERATHQDIRRGISNASVDEITTKVIDSFKKKDKKEQLKKNLKKGGKIALATGGVVAAGIGAKKLADKKKAKKEDKK